MRQALAHLASLRLSLAGMLWLGASLFAIAASSELDRDWLLPPLALLAVNLLAAIAVNRAFRRRPGLLLFHCCLLGVALLGALGQLLRFEGRIELTVGQPLQADAVAVVDAGVLAAGVDQLPTIVQGHFHVDYRPGLVRGETHTSAAPPGGEALAFGDGRPLTLRGYQFYSTPNKGYAAVVQWRGRDSVAGRGTLHFPSFPAREWQQRLDWTTPGGDALRIELLLPERVDAAVAWRLDSRVTAGELRISDQRGRVHSLAAGEWLALPGGALRFERLSMWMGYRISREPQQPWLLLLCALGALALGQDLLRGQWRRPANGERCADVHA